MEGASGTTVWVVLIVGLMGFMFYSQWRSRRRYQKRMEEMQVGDHVVTIGGIHGTLIQVDRESNLAGLEIAPNVVIEIGLSAIGQRIVQAEEESEEG